MRLLLSALLFAGACFAQETNLAIPATIGPVSIRPDTESLSAFDWSAHNQPVVPAFRMDIPKVGGGSEPFFIRPYPYGLSSEYAGLWEVMVDAFSIRKNFRYTHLLPKNHGLGAALYVGDRLDTGGLWIQPIGTLRVDANDQYVMDPTTGQPYLDNKAVRIMVRAWTNADGGDLELITAGPDSRTIFRGGYDYVEYGSIGPQGLIVGGVNYTTLIASLKSRLDALEQGGPASPPPTE